MVKMSESLFIELLQVVVGQRTNLSHTPSKCEWQQLFSLAEKQAVLGVCFRGIEQLHSQGQVPPRALLYEWIGIAESIRATNLLVNRRCCKLQMKLAEACIHSSILKGQAVARYYSDALYRQSGDIDVYVDCGRKGAIAFARGLGMKDVEWDYKHLHLNVFQDTEVEMHYRVEVLLNLWKNRKLQRWFKEHEKELFEDNEGITAPSTAFNSFYILLHIYRHFLYEGVGIRQLMDYYYVLRQSAIEDDIIKTLKTFGMTRFAQGVMWVMQTVFGLEKQYLFCNPLESEGRFILDEVMAGGNFGRHNEQLGKLGGKWHEVKRIIRHNLHLLAHYPSDVVWTPVWIVWHWGWKKFVMLKS